MTTGMPALEGLLHPCERFEFHALHVNLYAMNRCIGAMNARP
jgi:hypothetical protein